MPRKAAGLTAAKARTAKPGRHGDGGGLYLLVRGPEARFWLFRYAMPGAKLREMGLGKAGGPGAVSLAEAREKAAELRRLVKAGTDPLEHREAAEAAARAQQAAKARAKTFGEAGDLYLAAHEAGWRNPKHRAQWAMTLREYAGPHLGAVPVAEVETAHVAAALRPLWHEKPETASRLRGRIEAVLDFAAAHGWREGANPARWRGHLDKLFPRRGKVRPVEHHAALPWAEAAPFMAALRARDGAAARALEFAVLTAARSGEALGARWPEVDLEGAVWKVPKGRMEAGRERRVPLAPTAVSLLREMLPLRAGPDAPVFPGQRDGRPLSATAMAMVLRRMGRGGLTVHGFRSTFRDWAGETTRHAREVVEAALAHRLGGPRGAGLRPRRPVRQAPPADGGLGGVLRRGAGRSRGVAPRRGASVMPGPDRTTGAPSHDGMGELSKLSPRTLRRFVVALAMMDQVLPQKLGSSEPLIDTGVALCVLDAANPPKLDERRRRQLAAALMRLAVEILSEILIAADDGGTAAFDAKGSRSAAALEEWMLEAQRRGRVDPALAGSLLPGLAALRTRLASRSTHSARARGRRPKGDVRAYGALLSFYQVAFRRLPRRDKDTLAFVQRFMEAAGPAFDAAERLSRRPPSGKTAGRRWLPITEANFRRRFKEFEDAKDPARAQRLVERAGEIGKE